MQATEHTQPQATQITLDAQEWQRAIDMLDTPAKPNKAMQRLFDRGFKRADN